jgi:hypothetical protein
MDAETLVATVTHLFIYKGAAREVAILATSTAELEQTDYDNWNNGTYGFTLRLCVPLELYVQISDIKGECEISIAAEATPLFSDNEYLSRTVILPLPVGDPAWRDKARSWLAGSGVNNQGRVRSDNIASRECDGLLFRSEPEILLYNALKSLGVSFAPLPVFLRGGQTYQRIEPDFVIIRDGMVMIVEVDGDTVHLETPAEAHARTTMLVHEGAHLERVKASQCDTPEKAAHYARSIIQIFEKLKASR